MNPDQKIFQVLKKSRPIKGDIGIEIEAEGRSLGALFGNYWTTVDDGSLRGLYPDSRAEYILTAPIVVNKLGEALDELENHFKNNGSVLNFSFRTSVHVHVNIQDMTAAQLSNYIYLWMLFEEPLMTFCGKERKGNRFCLRYRDAEGFGMETMRLMKDGFVGISQINREAYRYSACNIAALRDHGSLEFRGMRGTNQRDTLSHWVGILWRLKTLAMEFKNPIDIYNHYIKMGVMEFYEKCFGEYSHIFSYAKLEKELYLSFSIAADIPMVYRTYLDNWKQAQEEVKKAPGIGMNPEADVQAEAFRAMQKRVREFLNNDAVVRDNPFEPAQRVRRAAMINPVDLRGDENAQEL